MPKSSGRAENLDYAPDGRSSSLAVIEHLGVHDHAVEVARIGDPMAFAPMRSTCATGGGIAMSSGIPIHSRSRSSCGTTNMPWRVMRNSPTTVGCARRRILPDLTLGTPVAAVCVMRAMARSPFMAPRVSLRPKIKVARHPLDRTVGNQEAVAVAMNAHAPGQILAVAGGSGVMLVGERDQVAARGETVQGGFDDRAILLAPHAQFPEQVFDAGPAVRLPGDVFEQLGVGHVFHDSGEASVKNCRGAVII